MQDLFTRALDNSVFSFEFSLVPRGFSFLLIGHCDYSGFSFMTLNREALNHVVTVPLNVIGLKTPVTLSSNQMQKPNRELVTRGRLVS